MINFDLPANIDDYVHRIGRTGRAGQKGLAYSFFNPNGENEQAMGQNLIQIVKDNPENELPQWLADFLYLKKRNKKIFKKKKKKISKFSKKKKFLIFKRKKKF